MDLNPFRYQVVTLKREEICDDVLVFEVLNDAQVLQAVSLKAIDPQEFIRPQSFAIGPTAWLPQGTRDLDPLDMTRLIILVRNFAVDLKAGKYPTALFSDYQAARDMVKQLGQVSQYYADKTDPSSTLEAYILTLTIGHIITCPDCRRRLLTGEQS